MVETLTNVVIGYVLACFTQWLIFPWFGLYATLGQNLAMGMVFTAVSVVRGFTLRRVFEAIRVRSL